MKVKNIKSFIDFYSSMGISLEIEKIERKNLSNLKNPHDLHTSKSENCLTEHSTNDLKVIYDRILNLDCNLKDIATNMVLNDGKFDSEIMFVGEAPGAEEDKLGKPFVGQAGKLLDQMLNCIGLNRKINFYITNIVFWRPPGNRTPSKNEINTCLPITKFHIKIFQPKLIIFLGNVAAKSLLKTEEGISKLRGRKLEYIDEENNLRVPAIAFFHPAYLLRNPIEKKKVWEDLIGLHNYLKDKRIRF